MATVPSRRAKFQRQDGRPLQAATAIRAALGKVAAEAMERRALVAVAEPAVAEEPAAAVDSVAARASQFSRTLQL